jgi:hypothetical protein
MNYKNENMDSLRLKRFRCFEDTGNIEFAPLNLLVGANSSGKSSFLKFFYLLKQTIRENRRGVFLWNSQNANSVDFKDFTNTVKDGTGSIEIEFSVKDLPIYGNYGRTNSAVSEVCVSFIISKQNDYFDYLEKLTIQFDNQIIVCSFDEKQNSVVEINGETLNYKNEKRITCHTNSLLPTFKYFSSENDDDDCSHEAKEEIRSLVSSINLQGRSIYRLLRRPFLSKEKFRKRLVIEFGSAENFERLNNLYLYYTLGCVLDSINIYVLSFTRRLSYMLPLRAFAERYYRIQNSWIEDLEPDGRNLAMYLFHLDDVDKACLKNWIMENFQFTIDVIPSGSGNVEINIQEKDKLPHNLIDVGFGYSQFLPLIVKIWKTIYKDMPSDSKGNNNDSRKLEHMILMEQPELHLHPRLQEKLGAVLAQAVRFCREKKYDVRFLIETHSEAIVNAVGREIAINGLNPDDVSVLLFNAKEQGMDNYVERAYYSKEGYLMNWPIGFLS